MKGRSNYACLYRIQKAETQPILESLDEFDSFRQVSRWSRESETGDRAELTDLPENLSYWRDINAKGEICLGQKCPNFEPCFITRMRQRADDRFATDKLQTPLRENSGLKLSGKHLWSIGTYLQISQGLRISRRANQNGGSGLARL